MKNIEVVKWSENARRVECAEEQILPYKIQ